MKKFVKTIIGILGILFMGLAGVLAIIRLVFMLTIGFAWDLACKWELIMLIKIGKYIGSDEEAEDYEKKIQKLMNDRNKEKKDD